MSSNGSERRSPTDDEENLRELVRGSRLPMLLFQLADRTLELERVLRHIAREIEATGVLAGSAGESAAPQMPAFAGLSSRELEIVRRLLDGDRVPMIARQLFLSESTVRNHLTSVYRKLGVRSQQQLLSLLRAQQVR